MNRSGGNRQQQQKQKSNSKQQNNHPRNKQLEIDITSDEDKSQRNLNIGGNGGNFNDDSIVQDTANIPQMNYDGNDQYQHLNNNNDLEMDSDWRNSDQFQQNKNINYDEEEDDDQSHDKLEFMRRSEHQRMLNQQMKNQSIQDNKLQYDDEDQDDSDYHQQDKEDDDLLLKQRQAAVNNQNLQENDQDYYEEEDDKDTHYDKKEYDDELNDEELLQVRQQNLSSKQGPGKSIQSLKKRNGGKNKNDEDELMEFNGNKNDSSNHQSEDDGDEGLRLLNIRKSNPLIDDNAKQKEFLVQFGALKLILGVILFLSIFLTVFGFVAFAEIKFPIFSWIGSLCLFLNVLWLLGIISIFKVEQDLQRMYFSNLSGTIGFEALFVFFNLCVILLAIFVFLGITAAISLDLALAQLESLYHSKKNWDLRFDDQMTLESVQTLTKAFYIVGSIGATQASNRITAFFYTFNNILYPLLMMLVIYMTIIANDQVTSLPIIGDRFMPFGSVSSIIALVVVMMTLLFLGYVAAFTESKVAVETYGVILIIGTVGLIIQSSFATYFAAQFDDYYSYNWGKLMIQVHEKYFDVKTMGCYGGKYMENSQSPNFYDLKCSNKNEIAYIWEQDQDKYLEDQSNDYSCINIGCKAVFGQWVSTKLKYLGLVGFTSSAICMIMIGITYTIWKKMSNGSQRIMWHNKPIELFYLGVTLVVILVVGILTGVAKPEEPQIFPYSIEYPKELFYSEVNSAAIKLRKELLEVNKNIFTVYGLQISEDQSQCRPDCNPLLYYLELKTKNGKLFIDNQEQLSQFLTFNKTNGPQADGESFTVAFSGDLQYINQALSNLTFGPFCPFNTGQKIRITATAQGKDGKPANGQMISAAAGQAVEARGFGTTLITFSEIPQDLIMNDQTVKLRTRVQDFGDEAKIQDVSVTATYFAFDCSPLSFTTDKNGEFSMDYPIMKNNLPYQVSFKFELGGYKPTQRILQFGGIVQEKDKYLQTYLIRSDQDMPSYYKTQLIDSVSFEPVKSPTIKLYPGGNATQLQLQTPSAVAVPDQGGYFELFNQQPGQYVVLVNDTTGNYMKFVESSIFLLGDQNSKSNHNRNIILNQAFQSNYQARLVLSWVSKTKSSQRDLDLFVDFKLNDRYSCSIGFYNPLCQGIMGNFDSQNEKTEVQNVETVTFNVIGQYKYLVYVGEFLDKQQLMPQLIQDTEARIDLYIKGHNSGAVAKFNIPFEKSSTSVNNGRPYRYWGVFCFDGSMSLNKINSLSYLSSEKPSLKLCDSSN
eukprot:403365761